MTYLVLFLITFLLAWLLAIGCEFLAKQWGIVDRPDEDRKRHKKPTPLLGGTAVALALLIGLWLGRGVLISGDLEPRHWIGVGLGGLILILGGILDDIMDLRPSRQIIFPILAALAVVAGGVGIEKITDPSGSLLYLGWLAAPLTFLWLIGMMYTTKLLDGLDGLVTSLGAVGGIVIFLFTMTTRWYQPDIGLAALLLAGACLGFLILNWQPARIFLGEGGSLFIGFFLGVLSVISGGKIAIALLIMGLPALDAAWTIVRRLAAGKNPFKSPDRKHLHFRLLDAGFRPAHTVLVLCGSSLLFGLSGLFLQSRGKAIGMAVLGCLMAGLLIGLNILDKRRRTR